MLAEDKMGTAHGFSPGAVLAFRELTKTFGQTAAVDHVSFDVRSGEIHALVGENGAGKSTLIRMLAGDYTPDSGEILLGGHPISFAHPSDAIEHGIGFVHQIPMFVQNLSITENLLLGVPFTKRVAGLIDWPAEHQAARADLAAVGLSLDPRADLETLSAHKRQLVAVARALKRGPKVLVLDEVTASLSEPEVWILHSHIRSLRNRGVSIIYVSHRLEEIFRIADRVTVLRDGKAVATLDVEGLTQRELARHIVGYEVGDLFERRMTAIDTSMTRLTVKGLGDERLRNMTFSVSRGEVLGICGLGGSGRTRLLHMIFGLIPHTSGTILIDGRSCKFRDPSEALAAGVTLVTEDRIKDGFVQALPVWQNVTLPWAPLFRRWGFLRLAEEKRAAARSTGRLGVRMPSIEADMNELSGGNQQKAIFARWITGPLRILLLDEPTHGVDIRSKRQIYDIIRELAADGASVLLVSSEIEEIEALCQRAILLHCGEMIDELCGSDISKDRILHRLLASTGKTESENMSRREVAAGVQNDEARTFSRGRWLGQIDFGSITPLIFFVLLVAVFGYAEPEFFLTGENLTSILNNGAVSALLACGLTVVLVVGEFDLSIASAASFGGALAAVLIAQQNLPLAATIAVVVVVGAMIGLANSHLVTKFEIPALIATIGVSSLLDGLTLWVTGNTVIFTGFTDAFMTFGNWRIGSLQAPVFYLAAAAIILAVMLRYTATGRHMYATGGNRAASRLAGIRVRRQVMLAFVISGILGSLAGLVYTARQGSLTPLFGTAFLLPVFAACFLGSVTLTRRKFHILGTVLGVYLIETGTNGLLILGAPAYTQQLFAGAVLILATIGARYRNVGFRLSGLSTARKVSSE